MEEKIMNKNVKRIVAMAIAIGTISAAAPATNINLFTTKAYASTNDTDTLDSLKLETSSGSSIKLYSDNDYASDNKVDSTDVTNGDTYYAKTSSSTINISTSGPSSQYVKVFKGISSSAKGKSISSDITLSSGTTTTLTVRVYGSTPDSSITYDDDSDVVSEYKIKVKCTASDSSSSSSSSDMTADDYDSIYLDSLSIAGKSISLSESKINYSYDVDSDTDQVTVKAVPEDTDADTVAIDGDEVDDSDNYKKTVSLDKGENKIEIDLTDDSNKERVYTLTINRASTSSLSSTTGSTSTTTTVTSTPSTATSISSVVNKWVQVGGKWQYKDATGNPAKNTWMGNYFLQYDGNMATGWLNYNGKWYYLGDNGARKTGWQLVGGAWYYLDSQGAIQTGWIKDLNGKYYYLYTNGAMAYSTTIGGYKLGDDGAWIGK
jgi:glucan-binding YG repeat protein